MEGRNVLLAVVLSTVVLVFWATFFEPPPVEKKVVENTKTESVESSTPSIEKTEPTKKISRTQAINNSERITIENANIKGSISLEGAIIDDVIFKNYNEKLNEDEKVVFLNPKNSSEGYYIETGWASDGKTNVSLPLNNTMWEIKGNNKLTPNNPINLFNFILMLK